MTKLNNHINRKEAWKELLCTFRWIYKKFKMLKSPSPLNKKKKGKKEKINMNFFLSILFSLTLIKLNFFPLKAISNLVKTGFQSQSSDILILLFISHQVSFDYSTFNWLHKKGEWFFTYYYLLSIFIFWLIKN